MAGQWVYYRCNVCELNFVCDYHFNDKPYCPSCGLDEDTHRIDPEASDDVKTLNDRIYNLALENVRLGGLKLMHQEKNKQLQEENERLQKALNFYADRANWCFENPSESRFHEPWNIAQRAIEGDTK